MRPVNFLWLIPLAVNSSLSSNPGGITAFDRNHLRESYPDPVKRMITGTIIAVTASVAITPVKRR